MLVRFPAAPGFHCVGIDFPRDTEQGQICFCTLSLHVALCVSICLSTHKLFLHLTAVGLEPTPLRIGALSRRLRPLGQTVMPECVGMSQIGNMYMDTGVCIYLYTYICAYTHVRINLTRCVCVRRCVSLRLSLAPLSTQSFSLNKCAAICKYLLCFLCLQTHR